MKDEIVQKDKFKRILIIFENDETFDDDMLYRNNIVCILIVVIVVFIVDVIVVDVDIMIHLLKRTNVDIKKYK